MFRQMIYEHWDAPGFSSIRVVTEQQDGVDDIYIGRSGFVEIRMSDEGNELIPLSQVKVIRWVAK